MVEYFVQQEQSFTSTGEKDEHEILRSSDGGDAVPHDFVSGRSFPESASGKNVVFVKSGLTRLKLGTGTRAGFSRARIACQNRSSRSSGPGNCKDAFCQCLEQIMREGQQDEEVIRQEELSPLSDEDYKRAGGLKAQDAFPTDGGLALYSPHYFEGDIIGSPVNPHSCTPLLHTLLTFQTGRNAVRDKTVLWPNGRIPYVLSRKYSARDRAVLAAAINGYADKTCIRFEPKTPSDYNFIYIYPGNGCASQVGRGGGMQLVSLGVGCMYVGISQHELMHVVGFWHEQSRFDRDQHIRINWQNIEPGMEYNFDKYSWNDIQHLDIPYDLGSVMHYGTHAFSRGYGPTISPLDQSSTIMGQRAGLSPLDIEKINRLYSCKDYLTTTNYTTNFQNQAPSGSLPW